MSRGGWQTIRVTVSLQFLTSCMTWSLGAFLTSSPLMVRIWSPGISLFTLGPPLVTNLKKKQKFHYVHFLETCYSVSAKGTMKDAEVSFFNFQSSTKCQGMKWYTLQMNYICPFVFCLNLLNLNIFSFYPTKAISIKISSRSGALKGRV